ncbi:MAG: RNA polymerase sigma factor [Ignavibacteria bacterium]
MLSETSQFLELLRPEYNDALKYCKALCAKRSIDDAEDVLQQSLLKSLENFDRLNDRSKFRSWFFKIITREFFNSVRKDFWRKFIPLDNAMQVPEMPEVFDRLENDNNKIILSRALSRISSKERSAILLFEIGGFSIEEIRDIQNEKSTSAIKSRLSRAREKLRKIITNEEGNISNKKNKNSIIIGDLHNETVSLIHGTEGK